MKLIRGAIGRSGMPAARGLVRGLLGAPPEEFRLSNPQTKDAKEKKVRVFNLAKELNVESKLLLDYCKELGVPLRICRVEIEGWQVQRLRGALQHALNLAVSDANYAFGQLDSPRAGVVPATRGGPG